MTLATLFSGIGAPEFAARRVFGDGVKTLFACEIDKFARQAYLANHAISEAKFYEDITKLDATPYLGKVDILVGGSPCQDFSIAGLKAGVSGKRGALIWQYYRVISECKPSIFIYENVKGMTSDRGGKTLAEFLEAFRSLGYFCHAEILNTKDYGIPQNRERIYIVGFLDSEHYHAFCVAPKQPLKLCLGDMLEANVAEKFYLSENLIATFKRNPVSSNKEGQRDTSNFIKVVGNLAGSREDISRVYEPAGLSPTLNTAQGGNREVKILQRPRGFNAGGVHDVAPTLSANSYEQNNLLTCGGRIRKLTPRECLRLQGFRNDEICIVTSDTQAYKQAGNAMSVNVVEMIFRQILASKDKTFELRSINAKLHNS